MALKGNGGRTNYLVTEEVLAGFDAFGDGEGDFAPVGDEGVDGPCCGRRIVSVLVDLEPL